ncbi:MAG: hypothetical protein ACYDAY_01060 [Candidatus Dormibacteria bacterium]
MSEVVEAPVPEVDVDLLVQQVQERVRQRRVRRALEGLSGGDLAALSVELERDALVNPRQDLRSHRAFLGGLVTFLKRAARVSLRWYIEPLVRDQNTFNSGTARLFDRLVTATDVLLARVDTLERRVAELEAPATALRVQALERRAQGDLAQTVSAGPAAPVGFGPDPEERALLEGVLQRARESLTGQVAEAGWICWSPEAAVELPAWIADAAASLPAGAQVLILGPDPACLAGRGLRGPGALPSGAVRELLLRAGFVEVEVTHPTPWPHEERLRPLGPFPLPGAAAEDWLLGLDHNLGLVDRTLFGSRHYLVTARRPGAGA